MLNMGSSESYTVSASKLLKICSNQKAVNKLYQREFKRVEYYDDEEEETVYPDCPNGYQYLLNFNSFFRSCDKDKIGMIKVQESSFLPLLRRKDLSLCKKAIF